MNIRTVFLLAMACSTSVAWATPGARLILPDLRALEAKATESVDVSLDEHMLAMASGFLDSKDPTEAKARDIVRGLTGVYVRSFTFDSNVSPPQSDIDALRKQLVAPQWNRIVGVHSRKESSNVEVFLHMDGQQVKGLAVLALEPRQFTIVNIVGAIDLQKLRRMEGQLGVPKFDLDGDDAAKKSDRK